MSHSVVEVAMMDCGRGLRDLFKLVFFASILICSRASHATSRHVTPLSRHSMYFNIYNSHFSFSATSSSFAKYLLNDRHKYYY